MLSFEDPDFLQEMLQQLPKPLYWAVNSDLASESLLSLPGRSAEEITSLDFQKAELTAGCLVFGIVDAVCSCARNYQACMDGFKAGELLLFGTKTNGAHRDIQAAAGEDCDAGSTVPPGMLVPVAASKISETYDAPGSALSLPGDKPVDPGTARQSVRVSSKRSVF